MPRKLGAAHLIPKKDRTDSGSKFYRATGFMVDSRTELQGWGQALFFDYTEVSAFIYCSI